MITFIDYLERRGHRFVRTAGDALKTICPLPEHAESEPSFTVWPGQKNAHCFGCGWYGDLVNLIGALEFGGVADFREQNRLAYKRAIELGAQPESQKAYTVFKKRPKFMTPLELQAFDIAGAHYQRELTASPRALDYLMVRGVRRPEELGLGYTSEKGFSRLAKQLKETLGDGWYQAADAIGLLNKRGGARLRDRIFIPWKARVVDDEGKGHVTAYYQARLVELKPYDDRRYLNPPGYYKVLFGLYSLGYDYPVVPLVEGPFDALPLHSVGVPAVALLGNRLRDLEMITPELRGRPVAIALDSDVEGEKAIPEIQKALRLARVPHFRFTAKSPHKDLGDWAKAEGPEAIADALKAAADLALFPKLVACH